MDFLFECSFQAMHHGVFGPISETKPKSTCEDLLYGQKDSLPIISGRLYANGTLSPSSLFVLCGIRSASLRVAAFLYPVLERSITSVLYTGSVDPEENLCNHNHKVRVQFCILHIFGSFVDQTVILPFLD